MLAMVIAATLAASDPGAATASPAAQGATVQAAANPAPAKANPHKSRSEQVICKTVQDPGIGTTRQACATQHEWSDQQFWEQQALRERQTGVCGVGGGC
jgi:hypothetical protein